MQICNVTGAVMQFFLTGLFILLVAEACQMHCIRSNVVLQQGFTHITVVYAGTAGWARV